MPVINARIDHCDYVRSRAGRNIPGRCYADVGAAGAGEAPNGLAGVLESPQLPEARVIGDGSRVDDVVGFGVLDIGSRRQLADQGSDILPRGMEAKQSGSAYPLGLIDFSRCLCLEDGLKSCRTELHQNFIGGCFFALDPLAADLVSVLVLSPEGQGGDDQQQPDIPQFLTRTPHVQPPLNLASPIVRIALSKIVITAQGIDGSHHGGYSKLESKHFGFDLPLSQLPLSKL